LQGKLFLQIKKKTQKKGVGGATGSNKPREPTKHQPVGRSKGHRGKKKTRKNGAEAEQRKGKTVSTGRLPPKTENRF